MSQQSRKEFFKAYREELKTLSSLQKTISKTQKDYQRLKEKIAINVPDFDKKVEQLQNFTQVEFGFDFEEFQKPISKSDEEIDEIINFLENEVKNINEIKNKNILDAKNIFEKEIAPKLKDKKIEEIIKKAKEEQKDIERSLDEK
ncbi:hypothetical protein [[Mycoplasma] gypis]|uniref:Uncharacterized protein n=1 Tax=[Mycoplasma] gypis TaxID=92404 RepID=A0ABZ2RV99_9BACT|nr:hypothetical protein [[Mycoplasma] gypis]MBN0919264.1 hypothetical protein [[Mycoplasma] gypis]